MSRRAYLLVSAAIFSSAPSGADRLRLERCDWRLERTDVAELGRHHCGGCPGLLRVQPCPTVCTKRLFQLN